MRKCLPNQAFWIAALCDVTVNWLMLTNSASYKMTHSVGTVQS